MRVSGSSANRYYADAAKDRLVRKYKDNEMKDGTRKQRAKFEQLTKADKRAWREALQRAINNSKSRVAARTLAGYKHGKRGIERLRALSNREQYLLSFYEEENISFQSGDMLTTVGVVVGAASTVAVAASLCHTLYTVRRNVRKVSGNAVRATNAIAGVSEKITEAMNSFKKNIEAFVERLKTYGAQLWKPILIGLALWLCHKYRTCAPLVVATVAVVGSMVGEVLPVFKSLIPKSQDVEPQSDGISFASDLLAMACTCWCPGKDVKSISGEFMKRASNFPRASDGIESFMRKALSLIEDFMNWVLKRTDSSKLSFTGRADAYKLWRGEVLAFLTESAKNPKLPIERIKCAKDLQIRGFGFHEILVTVESKRDLAIWMEKLGLALAPHEGAIAAENNVRATPYCMMIGGPSGVGKTTLVRFIGATILLLAGEVDAKNALENLWQKGTTEYWNGYIGQKCLVMDDCFQVKGRLGEMDSEAMQLIRAVGNWSYPLNFADLASKGKIYLDSPLIIGTTNCMNIHGQWDSLLTHAEALVRRFQTAVWVDVNPKYATPEGHFDFVKNTEIMRSAVQGLIQRSALEVNGVKTPLSVEDVLDAMPWDMWVVKQHDYRSETVGAPIAGGLRSLVEVAARTIRDRRASNKREIEDINQLLAVLGDAVQSQSGLDREVPAAPVELPSHELERIREAISGSQYSPESSRQGSFVEFPAVSSPVQVTQTVIDDAREGMSDAPAQVREFVHEYYNRVQNTREWAKDGYGGRNPEAPPDIEPIILGLEGDHKCITDVVREDPLERCAAYIAESGFINALFKMRATFLGWVHDTLRHIGLGSLVDCYSDIVDGVADFAIGMSLFKLVRKLFSIIVPFVVGCVASLRSLIESVFEFLGISKVKPEAISPQSNEREVRQTVNSKAMRFATFNDLAKVDAQVGVPPNEAVHDHVYCASLHCSTEGGSLGNFLGLGSDVYMFPKHYLDDLRKLSPDTVLTFTSAKHGTKGHMPVDTFLRLKMHTIPGYDIAAVSFGGSFLKATRNILKYFLTQHEMKNLLRGGNTAVRLDVASLGKNGQLRQVTYNSPTCYYHGAATMTTSGVTVDGLVRYTAPTVVGDCGSPLMVSENRFYGGRCIIGLHSAGRDNVHGREGYASCVTQELARELFNKLRTYQDDCVEQAVGDIIMPTLVGEARVEQQSALDKVGLTGGSFELLGELVKPVNLPTQTSLKESAVQRDAIFGPSPTRPAILRGTVRDGVYLEPMVEGLKAYQTDVQAKSVVDMEPIVDLAMKKHWEATRHHPRDILTFEEAISPPESWKMKGLNRKTSAGYKYSDVVTPAKPGKTAFFGFEGDLEVDDRNPNLKRLRDDVAHLISEAGFGRRTLVLCTDFLKDELRPLAKVEAVATRVISGTPLDYTIAVRMYFGAFLAAMFDTYVVNGMAPGINHYKEWFLLAEALRSRGTACFDGDFSRFDSSEQPWIHMAQLNYVNTWYKFNNPNWKPEDETVRYILWMDLVHSRHVCGVGTQLRYVVQWSKSLPSGHPLTTMVNSMYSLICLTGCYIHATGDFTKMWDHVYLCTFGDDNVSSANEEVRDVFNQVVVASLMPKLFGLTYTAGDKSGNLIPYKSLEEITFLKRSFAPDDDKENRLIPGAPNIGWVAPLAVASFLYEPYWYKNARTPQLDLETRIEHCLSEMSLHPAEVWDKYFPVLQEWCLRNDVGLKLTSRAAARLFVKTRFDVWF